MFRPKFLIKIQSCKQFRYVVCQILEAQFRRQLRRELCARVMDVNKLSNKYCFVVCSVVVNIIKYLKIFFTDSIPLCYFTGVFIQLNPLYTTNIKII
jgi:hypothetical protein